MSGQTQYIEIGTPDATKASAFYEGLLGWPMVDLGHGFEATAGAVKVGFHSGDPSLLHEVFYRVADLDAAQAKVAELGGTVNGEVHRSPGFGHWVECTDDQGARFGLVAVVAELLAPPPQVWPSLMAHDARGLISFLQKAFGFTEVVVYGEGDAVGHAQLSWPEGGGIMLGSYREGARTTKPGSFSAYIVTADPDAVHARAVAAGAEIVDELHQTDYGSRDFSAVDPEGNWWAFGTYRGEPAG